MKKLRNTFVWLLITCMVFAGCAQQPSGTGTESSQPVNASETGKKGPKILDVVLNSLGDGGTSDAILKAMQEATTGDVVVFECNLDASLYETSIMDGCRSGEYDLIVAINYDMREAVMRAAEQYPDQKFLIVDAEIDFSGGKYPNVVSYQGKQNECAFLTGALAAILTSSGAEGTNPEKLVGFVAGVENTAIQDFLVGYIDGVNYVDSEIEVLYSFIGDWTNTAKAKELGYAQFQQGADVSYSVAGNAGLGNAEAALESGCWNLNVDQDWAAVIAESNPALAEAIIASSAKDYTNIIGDVVKQFADGTLEFGKHNLVGYSDNAITMYYNNKFDELFTDEMLAQYQQICDDLAAGKIEVGTAIGATQAEIDEYKAKAKPFDS